MKCKKLLSTLLAISVSISSFAAALTITASADSTKKTMNFGGSVIAKDDNIYYGNQKQFRVLSTNGNTTDGETTTFNNGAVSAENALFVISENDFGKRAFDSKNNHNWKSSNVAKVWCKGDFYNEAGITAKEQAAILQTSKSDTAYSNYRVAENILENDKVFYISAKEAATYFNNDVDRRFTAGGVAAVWWLRSPYDSDFDGRVGAVAESGYIDFRGAINNHVASRPAFNLNLSSVLFTSAAEGGKSSSAGGGGEFSEISAIENNSGACEWKLTLKDENRNGFKANYAGKDGDKIQINYSGAKTGDNEKISYVITKSYIITNNKQTEIKYYGNQAATSTDGNIDIELPTMAAGDRLFVFNEQTNGDYKTDYSSELQEITIPLMITASANDSSMGSVAVSPQKPKAGESITLTAKANEGYRFTGFTSDDVDVLFSIKSGNGTFTMPNKDVTVTANFEAITSESITLKEGEVFDINGEEKTASTVLVKNGGKIKDLTGGKGILKVAKQDLYGSNYTDQFPLYDEENGGWRFFDCEIGAGYIEGDSSIIGTTLKFKDAETEAIAKRILASDNPGVNLDITLSKTDENGVIHRQVAEAPQGMIKSYAENLTKPILMGVSGLKPGMTISVIYRFANGLVISKEVSNATPYITLEAGADKNYIVKVYGTGLDGVVAVALYNSENEKQLINVSIQKVAEVTGQLQGDGSYMKAMWWSDLGTMTPLCEAVGKDLTITE